MGPLLAIVLLTASDQRPMRELAEEDYDTYLGKSLLEANADTRTLLNRLNEDYQEDGESQSVVLRSELRLIGPTDGHVFYDLPQHRAGDDLGSGGMSGEEQHDFFVAMEVPPAMAADEGEDLVVKRLVIDGVEAFSFYLGHNYLGH